MYRNAIFATLIGATLIGPCLCCCAFAGFVSQVHGVDATVVADDAKPPACPHCRTHTEPVTPAESPATPTPPQPLQDCPCCDERDSFVAIAPPPVMSILPDQVLVAVMSVEADLRITIALDASRSEHPHGIGTCTFLIDHCHRLRC